jgi:peptidoglycan/xylan/chitin deacetylase (PgdA/CDA1 family)
MIMVVALGAAAAAAAKKDSRPIPAPSCPGGTVALAFDDGPTPNTNLVLDALRAAQLRATFFVVGYNVAAYPDIARRIVAEGHTIANHTYDHADLTTLTAAQIDQEIQSTSQLIQQVTGVQPKFLRPPYGSTNDLVRARIAANGLYEVLWTLDSWDWTGVDSMTILNQVTLLQPGGVILMHDTLPTTLATIPSINWYFREYWRQSPICAGQLAPTTNVMPIADWPGQFFFVHAVAW